MKLTRLRIAGFKSFVEPTDFLIEPGLTGVIGPNGCGKSNLVEALRWVMGESSYKSMRASGMDDVIFSGSAHRPARNTAEVTVFIDNSDRTAPAANNASDVLEVSRRIAREDGSTYRINGREVRARDVQLLFADAATGARSPALVRQGQINEIIAAKPQARRRILEDAAGVAGLHARRHEAELRLKASEDNLLRVEDVLREIDNQAESLKRQGRQASRYRTISAEIRRLEALSHAIAFAEAREEEDEARAQADADLKTVAERTEEQTNAATAQAVAAHDLPPLRQAEAEAAAALQRLTHARAELDSEEARAKQRLADIERHILELEQDIARGGAERTEAAATIIRLKSEAAALVAEDKEAADKRTAAQIEYERRNAETLKAENTLGTLQAAISDLNAQRTGLERAIREETERAAKITAERRRTENELQELKAKAGNAAEIEAVIADIAEITASVAAAEEVQNSTRRELAATRERENQLRGPLNDAQRHVQRLEAEAKTLAKLLAPLPGMQGTALLELVETEKGYEVALGAALGDDLDASTDQSAPIHWHDMGHPAEDPPLPPGAVPLLSFVKAPDMLHRRLAQIGLVEAEDAVTLQKKLYPGQRLVSRDGGLWRWDGLTAAADAPTMAARRLAEKNRLGELELSVMHARAALQKFQREIEAAQADVRQAAELENAAIDALRQIRQQFDRKRDQLAAAEKREAEVTARRFSLDTAQARLVEAEADSRMRLDNARAALTKVAPVPHLEAQLAEQRAGVSRLREQANGAHAAMQNLIHEATMRNRRSETLAADTQSWSKRLERAEESASVLNERVIRARKEQKELLDAPDTYLIKRRALIAEIERAETRQKGASDRRAKGETLLAEADKQARQALEALSQAREARAGSVARHEAAVRRVAQTTRQITETLETSPSGLLELAGLKSGDALPHPDEIEDRLASLKIDRERLGAVNLRAEEELKEIEGKKNNIVAERDDLQEAIKRLRQAISNLNREGRERLLAAFDIVNGHFRHLFTTLFSGGTAELTLVDSDDPLEAGLDILARPPGKKPQTMTLLSGGEQALTAIALIFAVFLTNPSPICVLDEVDAPLDDANVERYCDLLDDMASNTETRFVVITHNPITMARMSRLFGVTMAEKGVSQLVSVDLEMAEQLVEAI